MVEGDLIAFFNVNFNLSLHYKFSMAELEEQVPYERAIYVSLMEAYIKDKNEEVKQKNFEAQRGR